MTAPHSAQLDPTSWWTSGTSRTRAVDRPHMSETKVRWAMHFAAADPSPWALPSDTGTLDNDAQGSLFGASA